MAEAEPTALQFAGFTLDPGARTLVDAAGREVPLRRSEYELLRAFLAAPGCALSRDHLLDAVAGRHAEPFDRSIDVLVGRLRRKIESEASEPRLIVTVPGVGYRFAARPQPVSAGNPAAPVAEPTPSPAPPASPERRQLTVAHCGLSGPALLAARRDPEDLHRLLAAFHERAKSTITEAGGTVDWPPGDGLVAYFGYPQADEHQAERAVRAVLGLIETASRIDTGPLGRLQVRVGVASGLAVVGGEPGASGQPTALGEAAHLAAGLASRAEPDVVLIAADTRRLVGELFELRPCGSVGMEAAGEPVEAWRVVAEAGLESRFEALRGAASSLLVGREEELALLMRRWAQAKGGNGRVVLVSGEPGIGKSRLTRALRDAIAEEPHVELRLFGSPHHQDSALYPHIAQLGRAAGFARDDTDETKLAKLDAVLAQSDATDEAVALIAELLSIQTDQRERIQQISPQARRERTLAALLAQLPGLVMRKPVLLIYDDLHWIDPTSRELLDRIIERLERLPVLLLATFRPEFQPPWAGQANVTSLALTRLDRRDTTAMIAGIAGAKGLAAGVAQEIAERTDGVPLFIEEVTKAAIESGLQAAETLSARPLPKFAVPATLHASLIARLDRLGPAARDIAQKSAAIGRELTYEMIAFIADWPQAELRQALDKLTGSGLVTARRAPPQAVYLFKHALVRDAAYDMLLRGQRQRLHARIGKALETHYGGVEAARPEVLAHHFTEAGQIERALGCLLDAGKQALQRSGMVEAEALLRRGLALLPRLSDDSRREEHELDLQLALGRALIATESWGAPTVGEGFARARELCDGLTRTRKMLPILYGQFVHHALRADFVVAERLAAEMRHLGEEQEDVVTRVMAYRISGYASLALGDFNTARAYLERSLALYDPADRLRYTELSPQNILPTLLSFLSCALACSGHLDQARARLDSAITEVRRLSHAYTSAYTLWWVGFLGWLARAEPGVLLQSADELLALSAEHRFAIWPAMGSANRGWCLAALGHPKHGISLLTAGLAEYQSTGNCQFTPAYLTMLADAHRIAGQPQAGLEHLAEAERLAETSKERMLLAETHRLRGDLLILTSESVAAEASYHGAIALAQCQGSKLFELRSAISLARLWRSQGRNADAHNLLAPIHGWFTEGFDAPDLIGAKALLDELETTGGRGPLAAMPAKDRL